MVSTIRYLGRMSTRHRSTQSPTPRRVLAIPLVTSRKPCTSVVSISSVNQYGPLQHSLCSRDRGVKRVQAWWLPHRVQHLLNTTTGGRHFQTTQSSAFPIYQTSDHVITCLLTCIPQSISRPSSRVFLPPSSIFPRHTTPSTLLSSVPYNLPTFSRTRQFVPICLDWLSSCTRYPDPTSTLLFGVHLVSSNTCLTCNRL